MPSVLDKAYESRRPTLVFLHFLGGSAKGWGPVIEHLDGSFRCLPLDLPGFGDRAGQTGYSVAAMADAVEATLAGLDLRRWFLIGHSMGAKVAAALARRAEDGNPGFSGLAGLILLAGSPPGPEPMDEKRRDMMMSWFAGDPAASKVEARFFIDQNVGSPLDASLNERAVADVLRANRMAWQAWLTTGSREDWIERVGLLKMPALIVAGELDADLGPQAQEHLVGSHFITKRHVTLPGAKHLLPLERPKDVADLIASQAASSPAAEIDPSYLALIQSDRVSTRTRQVLMERLDPQPDDDGPSVLSAEERTTLRAVVDRIVPQRGVAIDLGGSIHQGLREPSGDGWRFAALPPDAEAYRAGLCSLNRIADARHGKVFSRLDGAHQDAILQDLMEGSQDQRPADLAFTADQMRLWFEEVRADAVRAYVSHPLTLARLGYSGIANGGDGARKQGFVQVGIGESELWEPQPARRVPS